MDPQAIESHSLFKTSRPRTNQQTNQQNQPKEQSQPRQPLQNGPAIQRNPLLQHPLRDMLRAPLSIPNQQRSQQHAPQPSRSNPSNAKPSKQPSHTQDANVLDLLSDGVSAEEDVTKDDLFSYFPSLKASLQTSVDQTAYIEQDDESIEESNGVLGRGRGAMGRGSTALDEELAALGSKPDTPERGKASAAGKSSLQEVLPRPALVLPALSPESSSPPSSPHNQKLNDLTKRISTIELPPSMTDEMATADIEAIAASRERTKKDALAQAVNPDFAPTRRLQTVLPLWASGQPMLKRPLTGSFAPSKRRRVDRNVEGSSMFATIAPALNRSTLQEKLETWRSQPTQRGGGPGYGSFSGENAFVDRRSLNNLNVRNFSPSPSVPSPGASTINGRFDEELNPFPSFLRREWPRRAEQAAPAYSREDEGSALGTPRLDFVPDEASPSPNRTEPGPLDSEEGALEGHAGWEFESQQSKTFNMGGNSRPASPNDEETLDENSAPASRATSNTTVRRTKPAGRPQDATASNRQQRPAKKKRGPAKLDLEIPDMAQFVFVLDDDGVEGELKPFSDLPPSTASRLQSSLDSIYDTNFKRACTVTRPANSKTYVDVQVCLGVHMFSRDSSRKAPPTTSCSTCLRFPGVRPCVRLETDESNFETILVFYPRPADHRPVDAVWTQPQYWLGLPA